MMTPSMQDIADDHVVLAELTSPHGIQGWMKVYSYTSPIDAVLEYPHWWLLQDKRPVRYQVVQGRWQGRGLVVKLKGVDDRNAAEQLAGTPVLMPTSELPALEHDYYWYQLEGLRVQTRDGVLLGKISYLFETGANDVLVVQGDDASLDDRERLLPYLPGDVIKDIDLDVGMMTVDWDPSF